MPRCFAYDSKKIRVPKLQLVQDVAADALLDANPFALPMAPACAGPKKIVDRMGGFDVRDIADQNPDKFAVL